MREILFRGKDTFKNEWWHGSLIMIENENKYYITQGLSTPDERNDKVGYSLTHFAEVYKDTIGQFTGLLDKNGNKIFEGDILSLKDEVGKKGIVTVGFEDGGFIMFKGLAWRYIGMFLNIENELEIVGNIHDNKELLK